MWCHVNQVDVCARMWSDCRLPTACSSCNDNFRYPTHEVSLATSTAALKLRKISRVPPSSPKLMIVIPVDLTLFVRERATWQERKSHRQTFLFRPERPELCLGERISSPLPSILSKSDRKEIQTFSDKDHSMNPSKTCGH